MSWTVVMPVTVSFRKALSRAKRVRISRNVRRTLARNVSVTITISGSTENATSMSSALRRPIANRMPTSVNKSPKIATTPAVNSSLSTSTSFVTRVSNRPTGCRSK